MRDDKGRITGSLSSGEDITHQRTSERALRRSEQKLAGMIASMQEGIVYADEDLIVRTVNPYFCEFLGVQSEQIVGHPLSSFHSPELQKQVEGLIEDARQGSKRVYSVERELAGHHVLLRIQPVSSGEEFLGMVMTVHDITEQRTARLAAEAANQAKSSFLANVSHEIRTPMNGVLGMTAMLLETELNDAQQMFASTIQDSAEALLRVINDVLDFSQVEAGKLSLDAQDFDWESMMNGVQQILAPQAAEKNLKLSCCGDTDLPPLVHGDETRLRQILLNLGGNAVKFTDNGGVVLSVERLAESEAGVTVRFSVVDTGAGVAVEEQRRLFESFYQVDGSDTRRHGGSGLGLSISKQLVELMGGTIGLESGLGEGSCFWFTVTLGHATTTRSRTASGTLLPAEEEHGSRSGRILVVDDHRVNRRVARVQLERLGYDVELAASGAEALALTAKPRFDLVFMDVQMPEMNGFEVTRALRTRGDTNPAGRPLPVVAMTAHAGQEDRERCIASGMDDYMTKPVRHLELIRILDRHLDAGVSDAERAVTPETAGGSASPRLSSTAFSRDELLALLGGQEELLAELLPILREDADRLLEQLRRAIVERSAQDVVDVAHALKGVLGSVAGRDAADTARRIERLGRASGFEQVEGELVSLEREIARLCDAIEACIPQPMARPA